MTRLLYYLGALIGLFFQSCQYQDLSPHQYAKAVQSMKADLQQETTEGLLNFTWSYIPSDFQLLKSMSIQDWKSEEMQEQAKHFTGHHYATFRVNTTNGKKMETILEQLTEPEKVENYLNQWQFHAQNAFSLIVEKDTLPCVLYHLEKNTISQQEMCFTLVFKDDKNRTPKDFQEDLTLFFQESFFLKKTIALTIEKNNLNRIPTLKL